MRFLPRLLLAGMPLAWTASSGADDLVKRLQSEAVADKNADWGHWGPNADVYSSWKTHSNRLIPVYTFGIDLTSVAGEQSVYRDEEGLRALYGRLPEATLNAEADYFDQTGVHALQQQAAAAGKKCIVLFVFDGMDWQTTQAAAVYQGGRTYDSGRGAGLAFQDYDGAVTDFGAFVSSPHNDGTATDVNRQRIRNPGGNVAGGYCPTIAGATAWAAASDAGYPIGKGDEVVHAYADSAATATALCAGAKTYNDSINVDAYGRQVTPISRELQQAGFAVGVVTSVPISHATPACAYANNVSRNDYQDITRDQLGLPSVAHPAPLPGVDVLIGAGWGETRNRDGAQGENFVPGNRYLAPDDRAAIDAAAGGAYVVAERTPGAAGADVLAAAAQRAIEDRKRLFGFFGVAGGHLPYATADGGYDPAPSPGAEAEVYTPADVSENPTLDQMATTALDVLSTRSDRLWLMVEAGDVDWANHANNLDNSIGAVLSGDRAFQAVVAWIEQHVGWEDSALILTADHGHYLVLNRPEALIPAPAATSP